MKSNLLCDAGETKKKWDITLPHILCAAFEQLVFYRSAALSAKSSQIKCSIIAREPFFSGFEQVRLFV